MGEVIPIGNKELATERRQQLIDRAAHWAIVAEDAWRLVERAEREREQALRDLGMLAVEKGIGDEPGSV